MSKRITITVPDKAYRYVEQLVRNGIYGRNRADVARYFFNKGLVDAMGLGFIDTGKKRSR